MSRWNDMHNTYGLDTNGTVNSKKTSTVPISGLLKLAIDTILRNLDLLSSFPPFRDSLAHLPHELADLLQQKAIDRDIAAESRLAMLGPANSSVSFTILTPAAFEQLCNHELYLDRLLVSVYPFLLPRLSLLRNIAAHLQVLKIMVAPLARCSSPYGALHAVTASACKLRSLTWQLGITEDELHELAELPLLTKLHVELTCPVLYVKFPKLQHLTLRNCAVYHDSVVELPNLLSLHLHNLKIEVAALNTILHSCCSVLQKLSLSSCTVHHNGDIVGEGTARGFGGFGSFGSFGVTSASSTAAQTGLTCGGGLKFSPSTLPLQRCAQLRHLVLNGDSDYAQLLLEVPGTHLESLHIGAGSVFGSKPVVAAGVVLFPELTSLQLDADLMYPKSAAMSFGSKLTTLKLQFSADSMAEADELDRLSSVKHLRIDSAHIAAREGRVLTACTNLETLIVRNVLRNMNAWASGSTGRALFAPSSPFPAFTTTLRDVRIHQTVCKTEFLAMITEQCLNVHTMSLFVGVDEAARFKFMSTVLRVLRYGALEASGFGSTMSVERTPVEAPEIVSDMLEDVAVSARTTAETHDVLMNSLARCPRLRVLHMTNMFDNDVSPSGKFKLPHFPSLRKLTVENDVAIHIASLILASCPGLKSFTRDDGRGLKTKSVRALVTARDTAPPGNQGMLTAYGSSGGDLLFSQMTPAQKQGSAGGFSSSGGFGSGGRGGYGGGFGGGRGSTRDGRLNPGSRTIVPRYSSRAAAAAGFDSFTTAATGSFGAFAPAPSGFGSSAPGDTGGFGASAATPTGGFGSTVAATAASGGFGSTTAATGGVW